MNIMTALKTDGFAHPPTNVAAFGVRQGMAVADFGAGSGHYVLEIAKLLKNEGHIYAIDVQKELLARIRTEAHKHGFKNVETIWGDLEYVGGTKIADRYIDLVVISNLLFQLELKAPPIAEAKRILKPNGQLILIDWSESFGGLGPIKKHVVKKAQAIALAEAEGFVLKNEFSAGAHHYGLHFTTSRHYV